MDKKITGKSFLIIGEQNQSETEILKIAREFGFTSLNISPDLLRIVPEKKHISIEQVRNLQSTVYQKPVKQPFKIVIIANAQLLTLEAQNALLKLLEEPPRHAVVILQAKNKESLLPTIISRTTKLYMESKPPPSEIDIFIKNIVRSLEKISQVEDAQIFLDQQIVRLTNILLSKDYQAIKKPAIIKTIEACAQAKKMIEASVDPRFVLTNLVFTTTLASS